MIVLMKKITFLVSNQEKESFLKNLRKKGVLHVKNFQFSPGEDLNSLQDNILAIDKAIDVLYVQGGGKIKLGRSKKADLLVEANNIISSFKQLTEIDKHLEVIERDINWFKNWGGFNPQDIKDLRDKGIFIKLYSCTVKEFEKIEDKSNVKIINSDKRNVFFVFLGYSDNDSLGFASINLPDKNYEDLLKEKQVILKKTEDLKSYIGSKVHLIESFNKQKDILNKKLEFTNVKSGMSDNEEFSLLQGFCPARDSKEVVNFSQSMGVGYLIEDPNELDETPTLIDNPKWISIVNPIFKFMNTLPGYQEYDISLWFLVFFSIFFAMLIGDAGYGILFMLITFYASKKLPQVPKAPFFLIYLLSFTTIIWGAITGTWFGFEKIARLPFFSSMVIDKIDSFADGNQNFMIFICFVIGVIHLSIAHLLIASRIINSFKALAQIGWIMILWGIFFLAGHLVIGNVFPHFAGIVFSLGVVLVLVFSNFQKNIIKGILTSLADFPLTVISSFSDVVSYLRLFAVGYASVIVAKSFNDMALGVGFSSIFASLGAGFILFFGHALNIILGFMAVIVHGIRLNMLEFSGHLGMQWSGKEYAPFKE